MVIARNLLIALLALAVASCGRRSPPDKVTTINTPQSDIHLTFEYWNNGMMVSDSARLVAHLVKDGVEDGAVLIDGDYVSLEKIFWPTPDTMVVCVTYMDEVYEWQKEVTLKSENLTKTLYVELRAAYVDSERERAGTGRKDFSPAPKSPSFRFATPVCVKWPLTDRPAHKPHSIFFRIRDACSL